MPGRIASLFRSLLRRGAVEQALDDELKSSVELLTEEKIKEGLPPWTARRQALIELGGVEQLKEEVRAVRLGNCIENLVRDLRYGCRTLSRTPAFSILAVLVIALGIGATTALFTVVRSVLLKPLPFSEPSRLVRLYESSTDGKFPYNDSAGGVFVEWKRQSSSFSGLAILAPYWEYGLSAERGQLPEKVRAAQCSWDMFPVLGVVPSLGRAFSPEDDQPSASAVVLLSWGLWKRRFGGDPSVLNQSIHLDAKPYTIIGVMPAWFAYPEPGVQVWTPIHNEQLANRWQQLDNHMFTVIGRLKAGITEAAAREEVSLIVRRLHDEHLDNPFISIGANSRPLLEDLVGDIRTPLYVLLAATCCLLLIGSLNVAGLLVARGAARGKELAVRAAIGGSRWRLLGEHLTETILLSFVGGAVGLGFAYLAVRWFVIVRQDINRVEAIHMDTMVVAFAAGLIFLCALFAGFLSSFSFRDDQIFSALRESSRSHTSGHSRVRLRQWLLALEVGLTVVLLIGAGLLLKSYERLRSSDLGCVTNNVLTMGLELPEVKYGQPAQRVSFFETLLGRVRNLPGIQSAAFVTTVPGDGYGGDHGFTIAEHPPLLQGQYDYALHRWIDADYFETLGIPLLHGRTFGPNQRLDKTNEVIISDSFAQKYFADEDPIGKHLLTLGQRPYQVVGVVGDTRFEIAKPAEPMYYFPLYAGTESEVTLVVRSRQDVTSLALPIQQIVQQLDPEVPVSDILTMDQIIGRSTLDASFNTTLLLAFAVLSLVLAAVGLFAVLSYVAGQRTSEIGIRMALGAQPIQVLGLMLSDGLRPASIGLLLGLAGGVVASQMIRSMLYGVEPWDATVFAGVVVLMLGVASLACFLPAWRASRLDPIQALRNE